MCLFDRLHVPPSLVDDYRIFSHSRQKRRVLQYLLLKELLFFYLGFDPVSVGVLSLTSSQACNGTLSNRGKVLGARMRFDIFELLVQVMIELLVFILLVQHLLLMDLGSGQVRVGLEERAYIFVNPALDKLLEVVDIGIVFLQLDIWMTIIWIKIMR